MSGPAIGTPRIGVNLALVLAPVTVVALGLTGCTANGGPDTARADAGALPTDGASRPKREPAPMGAWPPRPLVRDPLGPSQTAVGFKIGPL